VKITFYIVVVYMVELYTLLLYCTVYCTPVLLQDDVNTAEAY